MPISVGSVCSGIEAASVAWGAQGFRFKWFSEIAPFPSKLLALKYPNIPNVGNMVDIPEMLEHGLIEAPDIICGGTPCQAFSYAGWQKGLKDGRGNLTLKFVDIVNTNDEIRSKSGKKPSIVFWENVEGVLSDKTNAFGCFISSLAGLKHVMLMHGSWPTAGFIRGPIRTVAWRVIDAKYFGVPQQRRRLYVIAGEDSLRPETILFERHCNATSEVEYINCGFGFSFNKEGHHFEVFRNYTDCLFSSYATKWNGNAAANNGSLFVVQDNRIRRLSPLECERLMGFPDGYTDIIGAKKSNRYQALGNSWVVPVISWIGGRIKSCKKKRYNISWFPIQSFNDYEYHDLSSGIIDLGNGISLNCGVKPEKCILGDMQSIVSASNVPDIYLSPIGCAGIIRRSIERSVSINPRLLEVLKACASTMDEETIEKRSLIQRRGKYSQIKREDV